MANIGRLGAPLLALGIVCSVGCGDPAATERPSDQGDDERDDGESPDDDRGDSDGGSSTPPDAARAPARDADSERDASTGEEEPRDPDAGSASDGSVRDDAAAGPTPPFEGAGEPWAEAAPRARCAESDTADGPLSGLDGNLRCNLEVAGKVAAPHFLSLAWYRDCAYVNGNDGTTVIEVASDGTPTVTTTLTEVGFRSNWESMKANEQSGLLAGYESNGTVLAVYDLTDDCAHPALQSSTMLMGSTLGLSIGHAGSFSPDGTIYYASSMYTSEVFAVDLAMPKAPKVITRMFERGAHDLFIGKDGTRGYFAYPNLTTMGVGSLAIMDLTQVNARAADAKGTLLKEFTWPDGNVSQYPIAVSYRGVDHLIVTDELGSGSCADPDKPQWGYARIFDISDEQAPKQVALVKTEAQDPSNCTAAGEAQGGTGGFGLGTHYCNVDRLEDPRLLSCGNWDGGLRIYDIRNPWRPKEVAYFDADGEGLPGLTRIYAEKREVWAATTPGTFYVLKIPPGSPIDQILTQ